MGYRFNPMSEENPSPVTISALVVAFVTFVLVFVLFICDVTYLRRKIKEQRNLDQNKQKLRPK